MNPFSKNIIFVDTEFSTLDPYEGEILSIALVKLDGSSLYLELEYEGEVSDFVRESILPKLTQEKVDRPTACSLIKKFVGVDKPYLVSYVNQFDVIYLYKLFGIANHPFHWLPVDFSSMLFAFGRNPESLVDASLISKEFGIDYKKYNQHHALDDAKLLRELYLRVARLR